jgi:hypothetical protein
MNGPQLGDSGAKLAGHLGSPKICEEIVIASEAKQSRASGIFSARDCRYFVIAEGATRCRLRLRHIFHRSYQILCASQQLVH